MAFPTGLRDFVAAKRKADPSSLTDNASKQDTTSTSRRRKRLSPPRQHVYIPSTEYLPNHSLALHKILPSNTPPPATKQRINFANARREYARQEHEQHRNIQVFWVPVRPARPDAAHLPPVAPDEIPVFHFPTASQGTTESVETTSVSRTKSNSRKMQTRRTSGHFAPQCPRPQEYRRRKSFEKAYIRHVQLYSQQQPSTTRGSLNRRGTSLRSARTSTRGASAPCSSMGDDDSFYWDDSMPIEQARYVQEYVQQAAMTSLINEVVEAYP